MTFYSSGMKKHFSLLLLLYISVCSSVSAQTLHMILFADTEDEEIGTAVRASHDNYSFDFLSSIDAALHFSPNSIDKTGCDCNRKTLLQTLHDLHCEENDIVIFIYVGHGEGYSSDDSDFPKICFAEPRNSADYYPLEKIRDDIMSKKPRFCLVIGDCCNSYPESSINPTYKTIRPQALTDRIRRQGESLIKKLFLSQQGSIILTAAQKGGDAWCDTLSYINDARPGMFMERNLNDVFQDIKDDRVKYSTWDNFLLSVKVKTEQYSNDKGHPQIPFYRIYSTDAPLVIPNPKEAEDLQQSLKQVADSQSYSDTERIAKSRALKSEYFDGDNARVEVVGKDKTTIILSTDIDKYLLKAATESDLASIIIMEHRKNNRNKVTYLKVHEIYVEQ